MKIQQQAQHASPKVNRTKMIKVHGTPVGGPGFVVMAGPCSIESYSQFSLTAQAVKNSGATLLRGGIWKMRTSASSFQGLGESAKEMIQKVLAETGLGLVSEITDPRQIEFLDPLVSLYQVGARNMYNYSLLKELGQTRKPVLLKRGFSALVDEWIKAADYVVRGGNDQVILCERGIRTFETSTRYTFDLNAVLVAKAETPFPVIVDPSHAVGISQHVPKLALAAAAAGADGLIVEVHPNPSVALSDGQQALSLPEFDLMTKNLERILTAVDRHLQRPDLSTAKSQLSI